MAETSTQSAAASPPPPPSAPPSAEPDLFAGVGTALSGSAPQAAAGPSSEPDLFAGIGAAASAPGAPSAPANTQSQSPQAAAPDATADNLGTLQAASPLDTLAGIGLGVTQGAFAAKDFFATGAGVFGSSPAESERSPFRQGIDQAAAQQQARWGIGASVTQGIGQAALGLLGAVAAPEAVAGGAIGRAAIGALTATATMEPHAANFANLAQAIPGMDGPIARFFASSPSDSDTLGYVKNALTSLGVGEGVAALFTGSAALLRAMRSEDSAAVSLAHADLQAIVEGRTAPSWDTSSSASPAPSLSATPEAQPSASPTSSLGEPSSSPPSPASSEEALSSPEAGLGRPSETATPYGSLQPSPTASSPSPLSQASSATPSIGVDLLDRFLTANRADQDALLEHGSWDAAITAGHTFAPEARIPWQIIGGTNQGQAETALDAFTARILEGMKPQLDDMKGGDVVNDAETQRAIDLRVKLWGEDQASLLGQLQLAGARAGDLRADMMAGFTVSQSIFQDAWTLAARIGLGDFTPYGSEEVAKAALKEHVTALMQAYGAANSIRANVGRAMRGLTSPFRLDPQVIRNIEGMDPDALVTVLQATKGDPRALPVVAKPGLWARLLDWQQLYLVNALVSSPLTHAVIAASNLFQAFGRPVMRMGGSLATGTWSTVGREAAGQYGYMIGALPDAFNSAVQAFKLSDSIIAAHGGSAVPTHTIGLAQSIAQEPFGPWDNLTGILKNTLLAWNKTVTVPTRFISGQDEMVKQVVYRGQVQAKALIEGSNQGLRGQDLAQYVKDRLYSAFDEYGRGTDKAALQEAKVATYQNDLNPGTFGAAAQRFQQEYPLSRVVVPFLRTPVNLFRQGVQLTPGLNLAQREYRQMISGSMGPTAQAQAVGQMGMGSLLMGVLGLLAYHGHVTGDAPSDPKLAAEAMQDGWRPNSIVVTHQDGSRTYVPFDRYDPLMMPMAMAANIVSIINYYEGGGMADQNKAQPMLEALSVGLIKQMTDKLYLQSMRNTLEALMDPDGTLGKWAGGMAGNYVPFSSALHLVNTDPVMREADGFISAALGRLPGFSADFRPRRDWAGDPVTVHKGLWLNTPADQANAEVQRLALQQGASIGAPSAKAKGGADLRGITMAGDKDPASAGREAYDRFQELAGRPPGQPSLRDAVTKLVSSDEYQKMPDGSPDVKGTKITTLADLVKGYRSGALAAVSGDKNVQQAEQAEQLRVGVASGRVAAPAPTPTNQASSMLQQLGRRVGLFGVTAPSPATPTTATLPAAPAPSAGEPDIFSQVRK